jgi:hypothetical protein
MSQKVHFSFRKKNTNADIMWGMYEDTDGFKFRDSDIVWGKYGENSAFRIDGRIYKFKKEIYEDIKKILDEINKYYNIAKQKYEKEKQVKTAPEQIINFRQQVPQNYYHMNKFIVPELKKRKFNSFNQHNNNIRSNNYKARKELPISDQSIKEGWGTRRKIGEKQGGSKEKEKNKLNYIKKKYLLKYCKKNKLKGYSEYNKKDLINFIKKKLT